MKIIYLITKTEVGGAQVHLAYLLKEGKSRGFDMVVISRGNGWLKDKTESLGIRFIENPFFANSWNPFKHLRSVLFLRKIIKKEKPDIVHAHSGAAGFIGRIASFGLAKKVFTAHGWSFTKGTPLFRRVIAILAENIITPFTDKIITVSRNDYNLAKKKLIFSKNKLEVVWNGIDIPENVIYFLPKINEKIKILFIGRLVPPKEPVKILQAISQLRKEDWNRFEVSIIGTGKERVLIEDFLNKNGGGIEVKMLGDVPNERVGELYRSSHIFALPTRWEGFPMTIIEAMSYGLPVIASDVGGIKEAIGDGAGVLMKKGEEVSIMQNFFGKVIENPNFLLQISEKEKERVSKEFSSEIMCEKVFAVYDELIK